MAVLLHGGIMVVVVIKEEGDEEQTELERRGSCLASTNSARTCFSTESRSTWRTKRGTTNCGRCTRESFMGRQCDLKKLHSSGNNDKAGVLSLLVFINKPS